MFLWKFTRFTVVNCPSLYDNSDEDNDNYKETEEENENISKNNNSSRAYLPSLSLLTFTSISTNLLMSEQRWDQTTLIIVQVSSLNQPASNRAEPAKVNIILCYWFSFS